MRKFNFEEIVAKSASVHNGKYVCVETIDEKGKPLKLVSQCADHGQFTQTLSSHLSGKGCYKCGREASGGKRRTTFEDAVAKSVEVHGNLYTYQSISYGSEKSKADIHYVCAEHGDVQQQLSNHLAGYGCKACGYTKRLISEEDRYQQHIEKAKVIHEGKYAYEGFVGESREAKLIIRCPSHGVFTQRFINHVNLRQGCAACGIEKNRLSALIDRDSYVEKFSKIHNNKYTYGELIQKVGSNTKIEVICPEHGKYISTTSLHLSGSGCQKCGFHKIKEGKRKPLGYYIEKASKIHGNNYTYAEVLYGESGGNAKLHTVCPEHGEFLVYVNHHISGAGCPSCWEARRGIELRYDFDEYVAKAQIKHKNKYSYTEVAYEKGAVSRVEVTCPKHGKFSLGASDHLNSGNGCAKCAGTISRSQLEVYEFLKPHCPDLTLEVRLDSSKKRWDMASKSLKVCVEYDGLIWHSSKFRKAADNIDKYRQAVAAGYRQFVIYSDEWRDKKELVKAHLLQLVHSSSLPKLHGRKLTSSIVSSASASEFLEINHLQGKRPSSQYVGLYLAGKLVAVLGYELRASGRGRLKDTTQLEITRYAASASVRGGFSKLLAYALKLEPLVTSCYTFSDNRAFTGDMYSKCGFSRAGEVPHSYFYTKGEFRVNKAKLQKANASKWSIYPLQEGQTERELAELNGYHRVYDCGKVKWQKTLK